MTIPVNTVFLAIQAGVRLYQGLRTAYVNSVRSAAITLPLPRAPTDVTIPTIISWFCSEGQKPADGSILGEIVARAVSVPPTSPSESEQKYLRDAYGILGPAGSISTSPTAAEVMATVSQDGVFAMLDVRQWAKGQQKPEVMQMILGTLIQVAVFWFANKPGAISERHPEGRALKAFLTGIEDVKFQTAGMDEIVSRMLTGILQSVAAEPTLIAGGKKEGILVTNVAKALSEVINNRLTNTTPNNEKASIASWAELIAGTLMKAGANTVLTDPALFLGVNPGAESEIAKEVGTAMLNLVVPPGSTGAPQLQTLLSGDGLETVVRASLAAIGRHPEIIKPDAANSNGVHKLVGALATAFADYKPAGGIGTAFPEIAAIVLEKTADNLDALWGVNDRGDPKKNLLVIASRHMLDALKQATQGKADPLLARDQVVALIDAAFAEVSANPRWVTGKIDEIGGEPYLAVAVEAALGAMADKSLFSLTGANRLAVLQAALKAAGNRLALVHPVPAMPGAPPGPGSGEVAIAAIIDAVFAGLATPTDAAAQWRLVRGATAVALLEIAFDRFAALPANDTALPAQLTVLRKAVGDFAAGSIDLDGFTDQMRAGLKAAA